MFWRRRAEKYDNNPLHEAVLNDDRAATVQYSQNPVYLQETNRLGFTPLQLAQFLGRRELIAALVPEELTLPPIEKDGEVLRLSPMDFEAYFKIRWLRRLSFRDFASLEWVVQQCRRAKEEGVITQQHQFLGGFYRGPLLDPGAPPVRICWLGEEVRWGVFAEVDLRPREFIGEYVGDLRGKDERADRQNSYCFDYLIGGSWPTPLTIDARDSGNVARFINHQADGNCDSAIVFSEGIMKVVLYANRPIAKGEQITYDYGADYWSKREQPLPMG